MKKQSPASILAQLRSKKKKYRIRTIHRAASDLGRLGGLVGGNARAAALTTIQRTKIASHAAKIRWGYHSIYNG